MEIGTIIGVLLTILVAVISSRSGKAKVTKQPRPESDFPEVNPPTGTGLPTFQEILRELGVPQEKSVMPPGERSVEQRRVVYETLETGRSYDDLEPMERASSLETIAPPIPPTSYRATDATPAKLKNRQMSPAVSSIAGQEGDDDDIDTAHEKQKKSRLSIDDFDLRKAVIYSEILHPRHLDY